MNRTAEVTREYRTNAHLVSGEATLDWNLVKHFLAASEGGSFKAAGRKFGVSPNVVRRKVVALEKSLGAVLFTRSNRGLQLTHDGRSVYDIAVTVQQQLGFLDEFALRKAAESGGTVRLAVTDGVGTFWVAPRLTEFLTDFPRIRVDLRTEMRLPDLSQLECDVAIQLEQPRDPDVKFRKLGTLHLIPFASFEYINRKGGPQTIDDLADHVLINLVAEQIPSHILEERASFDPTLKFARLIVRTASAQVATMAAGAGVGILPSYAAALSDNLKPIDSEIYHSQTIWLAYHPDAAREKRVRSMITWLLSVFDPKRFPWFRDEYIHPRDFGQELMSETLFHKAIGWRSLETL